jgi:predicted Zn-dependent protease
MTTFFGQRGTLTKAERLITRGDHEEAIRLLEKSLERNPRQVLLYKPLARAYASLENWDRAEKALAHGLELSPAHPTLSLFLGELYFDEGKFADAVHALEKCLHRQPENQLALNYLAVSLYKMGERAKALEILRDCGLSNNVDFLCRFAATFEEEIRDHTELYREPPREVLYARALWLYRIYARTRRLGFIHRAVKALLRWRYARLAGKLLAIGHFRGAVRIYDIILELSQDDNDALVGKGIAYLELKQYDKAKNIFLQLGENDPGNNVYLVYLSLCYYFQKKYHTAVGLLKRIATDGLEDYNANYFLGLNYLALGDPKAAQESFRRAFTKYYVDTMEGCVKDLLERILYSQETEESQPGEAR